MFNFTGSEKAAAALTPLMVPLTTIVVALLALAGMGEIPEPDILAQAIVFIIVTLLSSRLVWQVPNSTPEQIIEAKRVEVVAAKVEAKADKEIEAIKEDNASTVVENEPL